MVSAGTETDRNHRSLELDLQRNPEAPTIARAAVAGLCQQIGLPQERCQTLLLLVSEIVTNAVIHSQAVPGTSIRFRAAAERDRIRVDVHDGGRGFTPEPRGQTQQRGGWGLHLLDQEACCWGVDSKQGTLVWFELAIDPN